MRPPPVTRQPPGAVVVVVLVVVEVTVVTVVVVVTVVTVVLVVVVVGGISGMVVGVTVVLVVSVVEVLLVVVVTVVLVVTVVVVVVIVVVVEHIRCAWLQTPWPSQPAVVQLLPSVSVHGVLSGLGGWSHIPVWGLHGGSSVHSFVSGVQVSTW